MKVGSDAHQEARASQRNECCGRVAIHDSINRLTLAVSASVHSLVSRTIFPKVALGAWLSSGPHPTLTVPLCLTLHGNTVGFTWHPDHAAAEPQMNASLCRLPSPCCRSRVRGERLHSVYIIKARHRHRGLHIQSLPLSGFVSAFLSLSLTLKN